MQQKMCASNVLTRRDEERSTSGTTHSSHDVLPSKPSLPSVNSQSDNSGLPVPAYSTMQLPSFAYVFSNQGAVNFTVNICPSGVINHTKDKDDFDCDKLIQLEDFFTLRIQLLTDMWLTQYNKYNLLVITSCTVTVYYCIILDCNLLVSTCLY